MTLPLWADIAIPAACLFAMVAIFAWSLCRAAAKPDPEINPPRPRRAGRTPASPGARLRGRADAGVGHMTVHAFHADVHAYGLADACPRCTELAADPEARLDADVLTDLRRRIAENVHPRSFAEACAMNVLRETP